MAGKMVETDDGLETFNFQAVGSFYLCLSSEEITVALTSSFTPESKSIGNLSLKYRNNRQINRLQLHPRPHYVLRPTISRLNQEAVTFAGASSETILKTILYHNLAILNRLNTELAFTNILPRPSPLDTLPCLTAINTEGLLQEQLPACPSAMRTRNPPSSLPRMPSLAQ